MPPGELRGLRLHVHERGDASLDGILQLTELAERSSDLTAVLCSMCAVVAQITHADVVSTYVRDGDVFTMLGNVGFPSAAVGSVQLRLGEGIVGFVADRLRPVSVAVAASDAHYKHVPGLGEEQFPAMLAVPVLRSGAAAGVLVLQRRERRAFSQSKVAIATALAALFSFAVERADERARRQAAASPHAAKLRGTGLVAGAALGRAIMLPTLASLARAPERPATAQRATIADALGVLRKDLATATRGLAELEPAATRALDTLGLLLDDTRFHGRLVDACSGDLLEGLRMIARDYARVPYQTAAGQTDLQTLLSARAREVEDLCVLLHAAIEGRQFLRAGSIVVAERLGTFAALCAVARRAGAFVIDGAVDADSPGLAVARAAGIPLVSAMGGVFTWVRPDDLVLVDADSGTVAVNPSATQVVRFRKQG